MLVATADDGRVDVEAMVDVTMTVRVLDVVDVTVVAGGVMKVVETDDVDVGAVLAMVVVTVDGAAVVVLMCGDTYLEQAADMMLRTKLSSGAGTLMDGAGAGSALRLAKPDPS